MSEESVAVLSLQMWLGPGLLYFHGFRDSDADRQYIHISLISESRRPTVLALVDR